MLKTALLVLALSTIGALVAGIILLVIFYFIGKRVFRTIVQRLFGLVIGRLLEDKYHENLMELWSAVRRTSIQNILEISLRAEEGEIIKRPLGSSKQFPHYDNLMFVGAQMARLPKEANVKVDMSVTLGRHVEKPLNIQIPLMISGMGFGVALSEEATRALARAAKQLGTAINSGEGPFLQEGRDEADQYIWQIGRSPWSHNPHAIAAADMIEVQMGQGSRLGPHIDAPHAVKGKAQKLMGVSPVESVVTNAVVAGIQTPWDWPKYVSDLRQESAGKPIGVKIMSTGNLERDLAVILEAGFDVITIGGAQGGTAGASPLLCDDFGIPSLLALVRAERFLREQGARKEVSLVVAGGYATAGECLKAIALGADAIYLGTVPLFAMVHRQIGKILPWEPLTQLVWYDSPYKKRLDISLATKSIYNSIHSMVLEMEEGIRALGKTALSEVGPNDLVALDEWTAKVTGVKRAYPWDEGELD